VRYGGNPYFFCGRRPIREARIASYIVREHRKGRALREILDDRYLARCGSRELTWKVLLEPSVVRRLERDVEQAVRSLRGATGAAATPVEAASERLDAGPGGPVAA